MYSTLVTLTGFTLAAMSMTIEPGALQTPRLDTDRKTAVFVIGNDGTEITDLFAPYQVIAESGAFDTLVVAPERRPSRLVNATLSEAGVEILPDASIEDAPTAPDLIVIPYVPDFRSGPDQRLIDWIRANAGPETVVMSICSGTDLLAATGMLNGKRATTNHRRMKELKSRYPMVQWVEQERFVEDGKFMSSAALLAGIDSSIAAVRRLVGDAAAARAAASIGYTTESVPFIYPKVGKLFALSRFISFRDTLGISLREGVGELGLSSLLDFYATSYAGKAWTVGSRSDFIRTRNGMMLRAGRPTSDMDEFDRFIVDSNEITGDEPVAGALRWLSQVEGAKTAEVIRRGFMYPKPL